MEKDNFDEKFEEELKDQKDKPSPNVEFEFDDEDNEKTILVRLNIPFGK